MGGQQEIYHVFGWKFVPKFDGHRTIFLCTQIFASPNPQCFSDDSLLKYKIVFFFKFKLI